MAIVHYIPPVHYEAPPAIYRSVEDSSIGLTIPGKPRIERHYHSTQLRILVNSAHPFGTVKSKPYIENTAEKIQIDLPHSYISKAGNRVWSFSPDEPIFSIDAKVAVTTVDETFSDIADQFFELSNYQLCLYGAEGYRGVQSDIAYQCPIHQEGTMRTERTMDLYEQGFVSGKKKETDNERFKIEQLKTDVRNNAL
jgi:hypothetical protein